MEQTKRLFALDTSRNIRTVFAAFFSSRRARRWAAYAAVFASYLVTAKLGQFLNGSLDIAPALIWAPTGIGLAAVFLGGYRMLVPIFIAHAIAAWTSPGGFPLFMVIIVAAAYTLQAGVGAYALRRFGFRGSMDTGKDAILLSLSALLLPLVAPTITISARLVTGLLTEPFFSVWSRIWAGGALSIFVITSLITVLFIRPKEPLSIRRIEASAAFLFLAAATYVTFWTAIPRLNVFLVLYAVIAVFFWIGLRLMPHFTVFGIFFITSFGMLGSILARPTDTPLAAQLFADELFMILIAPIFLILSAVTSERLNATKMLAKRTRELEESVKEISHSSSAKNDFIAILAHELRNPLAPLLSTIELLKLQEHANMANSRIIQEAEHQIQNMRRLLDDLLDVSRISKKRFKLRKQPLDARSIIANAQASVMNIMHDRRHAFTVSLPEHVLRVRADPVRIEQIIVNLLNNAAKYTDPGGSIRLSAWQDGDEAVIAVSDNGIGIMREDFEKIFTPFRQVRTTSMTDSGLGIGLSLTKRLVALHDGSIAVQSDGPGRGSTFTCRFPVETVAPEPEEEKQTLPFSETDHRESNRRRGMSILIVDDNHVAAESMRRLLEYRGHAAACAFSGSEALECVRVSPPDILFLDIGLPDVSGYDVAKRLREQGFSMKIVALTGYGQEKDKVESLSAGCNHHLTKPVGLKDIESVLI